MTPFFISVVIVLVLFVIWVIVALILDRSRKIRRRHGDMMRVKAKYNIKRVPLQKTVIYDMDLEDAILKAILKDIPKDPYYINLAEAKNAKPEDVQMAMNVIRRMNNDHSGSFKRW